MNSSRPLPTHSRHAEFVELLRCHQHQLFSYLFALVRSQHDAEDLFQQSSLVWWSKFDEFRPGTNFVGWACRISQFEVLNFYKRHNRSRTLFSAELQDELAELATTREAEVAAERIDALGNCIARLSEADRQLLDLVYGADVSVRQVAERRGRSIKSVYNSLGRIRDILEACIRRTLARGGV